MSPRDRATMWMLVILLIATLVGTCTLMIRPTNAHYAPSGWEYPPSCCENDCKPIPCDEVTENAKGGYDWHKVYFPDEKVHESGDKQCHACAVESAVPPYPRCLFIKKKEIF
jgi:hypothetical protein